MKVACKNAACRYWRELKGNHCSGEDICQGYMTNARKAQEKIPRCKDCEYHKIIYTNGMKEFHHECVCGGKRRVILLVEERLCDCRV